MFLMFQASRQSCQCGELFTGFASVFAGRTFLFAEVVDFDIRGEKATSRVSSRSLWAEAKPELPARAFARMTSDTGTEEVASVVLGPKLSEDLITVSEDLITVDA